jgi:epoxyqueuosine reductase
MKYTKGIQILKDSGLNIFVCAPVNDLPEDLFSFSNEQKSKTLCLIGNGGKSLWEQLPHPLDVKTHPIDLFTKYKMQEFSNVFLESDIEILYPNDRYILPLQKIGRAFNLCTQSPIGLDINAQFGLWFAFRGVFLTSKKLPILSREKTIAPCDTCKEKPCLQTTDINLARLKCPVKNEQQYFDEQIKYHQRALDIL